MLGNMMVCPFQSCQIVIRSKQGTYILESFLGYNMRKGGWGCSYQYDQVETKQGEALEQKPLPGIFILVTEPACALLPD